jgi:hypothetical protein
VYAMKHFVFIPYLNKKPTTSSVLKGGQRSGRRSGIELVLVRWMVFKSLTSPSAHCVFVRRYL